MKRLISILLCLFLVVGLMAGCSSDDDEETEAPDEETEAPAETEAPEETEEPEGDDDDDDDDEVAGDIVADVFIYDFSDPYITTVRTAMADYFNDAGITANFHDAANDQSTQNDQIDSALSIGTDILIVNIVTTGSEDAAMGILDRAIDNDLPIIFFNREVSDDVVNAYDQCVFVGTDADEAGYMQGQLIFDILSEDFDAYDLNGDGEISYIMFKGELGNAEADGRTQYSVEEANRLLEEAGLGTLTYYDANNADQYQACDWKGDLAMDDMATALTTNPFTGDSPIELVIANNDDMALGAIEALNEAGYNTGEGDSIPVVGVDAIDAALDAIAAGKMAGSILQDGAAMAEGIVALVKNVANGDAVTEGINTMFDNVEADVLKVRIPYAIV